MNLTRIFANAFARRIAYVVLALVLAWLGVGHAKAQNGSIDNPFALRVQAYNACQAWGASLPSVWAFQGCILVENRPTWGVYQGRACSAANGCGAGGAVNSKDFYWVGDQCPSGQVFNELRGACQASCAGRTSQIVTFNSMIPSGSVQCHDGCESVVTPIGDGTYTRLAIQSDNAMCNVVPNSCTTYGPGYVMNYGTGMCQPTVAECAENETKDPVTGVCSQGCPAGMVADANGVCKPKQEDCPAGNVRAPSGQCLPGDGQCAAGEARRENGTCGKDSDGDGEADEDDDDTENDPDNESASGGDSCNAPPSCSGGAIACMQVKIQWRIDCNTRRKVNVSGGACSAMPVCTGENCDAMQYASLLQQWKASCNLEKLLAKDGETGDGGQPEWTKVNGMSQDPGAGETPNDQPTLHEKELSTSDLDQGGFGGGGGCIGFAASTGSGVSSGFLGSLASPPAFFCNYIAAFKAAMILLGALASCVILARGGK